MCIGLCKTSATSSQTTYSQGHKNSIFTELRSLPLRHNRIAGLDLSEIQMIDLKQFRSSNLPGNIYLLLLLPVIGWIALGCLKYHYIRKHRSAEQIMTQKNFDSEPNVNKKIAVISEAIKVCGPHAWQYRLELARLHLLNGEFRLAAKDLVDVKSQRGTPTQTGHYNVRKVGLVSFKVDSSNMWVDGQFVIQINYHNGPEALLHAAIFAANKQSVEAYDAYNEVLYYDKMLSNSRKHQSDLVKEMIQDPSQLDKRGREIITVERVS